MVKPPAYLDTTEALARIVPRLLTEPRIALDTESNTLFSYRERLCLVQVSTRTRDWVIDPFQADVALLAPVLADPGIVKVFHDAELDVLLLRRAAPFEIASIFDTQVAAAALGLPQLGLASLLERFFGVKLDKRCQRSDWGQRPLDEAQLAYAGLDTHWLLPLAAELRDLLSEAPEVALLEVAAECRRVASLQPEERRFDPDEFTRAKGIESLDGLGRRVLRELWTMRDGVAAQRDCPPFKVLSNDMLLQLARARPADRDALRRVKAVSAKLATRWCEDILTAVRRGVAAGPLQRLPQRRNETDGLADADRATYEQLRVWRTRVAKARPTDASLVLARSALLALARLHRKPRTLEQLAATGILEPWRVQHYGQDLLAILARAHA